MLPVATGEFDLIRRYFTGLGGDGDGIDLAVGDDCALLSIPADRQLAVTTDTLVESVHFPANCDPALLARRALRVNLSDLAAMGARPLGFQLALTLPSVDVSWLAAFSLGLAQDASTFQCPLVGGDTTKGPLTLSITLMGTVERNHALRRDGAADGDYLYVTGTPGDAGGGLAIMTSGGERHNQYLLERYWLPTPRLAAGELLAGFASAAIDVSDGLVQDAGHLCHRSGLGCSLVWDQLPLSTPLVDEFGVEQATRWALSAGDDYELCFSVPPGRAAEMELAMAGAGEQVTRIGVMGRGISGVSCVSSDGQPFRLEQAGYAHF